MAILRPMVQQGPYIPFDKPVEVPGTLADELPLMSVCFNDLWAPSVIGALKVLCRPETWAGTEADIKAAIGSAHEIIASLSDGCSGASQGPNWYLDLNIDYVNYDADAWNNPIYGLYGDGTRWAKYTLVVWGSGLGGEHFTVVGRDALSGDLVGGHFDDVTIINEADPAGQTFVLTTVDCLNNTVVHSDFTPRSYLGDMKSWEFTTGNITVYILKFLISGDWLCTAA